MVVEDKEGEEEMDDGIWHEKRRKRKLKGSEREVGQWAAFTRPRLVPKTGRCTKGWIERQQVRQNMTSHRHTNI